MIIYYVLGNTFKCITSKYLSHCQEMDFPGDGWLQWSWLVLLCFAYFRSIWIFKQFSACLAIIKLLLLFTPFPHLFNFILNIPMWMLRILWQKETEVRSHRLVQSFIAAGTKDQIFWLLDWFSNSHLIGSWAVTVNDMNFIFFTSSFKPPPPQPTHQT